MSFRVTILQRTQLPLVRWALALFLLFSATLLCVDEPVKAQRAVEKAELAQKFPALKYVVPVWLYKGLKCNVALSAFLLILSPWLASGRVSASRKYERKFTRKEWGVALLMMAAVAWQHAPRLDHSMWGDEEYNMTRFVLPKFEPDISGVLRAQHRPWIDTLWSVRKPTNHLGFTLMARVSHDLFFTDSQAPQRAHFSERILRMPIFIAGILTVPALMWALKVWGLSSFWALLYLLLHPWFLRFGVDGRGYGLLILFSTLMLGTFGKALFNQAWHWWILSGFCGFMLLWANLQGLYVLVGLHLLVAVHCAAVVKLTSERWILLKRWIVSGFVTGFLVIGYLAPCLPQILDFLAKDEIAGEMTLPFLADTLSAWWFGQPWISSLSLDNPWRFEFPKVWWAYCTLLGFLGLLLMGLLQILKMRRLWPLFSFAVGAPALLFIHMWISGKQPYDWYLSPFLPGICVLIACGVQRLERSLMGVVWIVLTFVGYGFTTFATMKIIRNHALEPSKDSVASYRQVINPYHSDIEKEVISGAYYMYTEGYDPAFRRFKDVEGLQALMLEADRSSRKFYVNAGNLNFLREADGAKEITAILEKSGLFEPVKVFHGLMPFTSRYVFEYRNGTYRHE